MSLKKRRTIPAIGAGILAFTLFATPASAAYQSPWLTSGLFTPVNCGVVQSSQGPTWASANTGGCNWRTSIRVKYVDYGRGYTSSWVQGTNASRGASYISAPQVMQHQVAY